MQHMLKTPTAVHIEDQVMLVSDAKQGFFILHQFRNNLMAAGFSHVEVDLTNIEELRGDGCKVTVHWTAIGKDAVVMTQAEAHYICIKDPKVGWQVSMIEFDLTSAPQKGRFLGGMPLV